MPSALGKTWKPAHAADLADRADLAADLGVSELMVSLLAARGLTGRAEMDAYLSPGLRHLCPPETIPGLAPAASVLAKALGGGKRPAVFGDYDVDGVSATALLLEFLRAKGFDPLFHLPNRKTEGYGLNIPAIEKLAAAGAGLLISVDLGITNPREVARARELGMTVVVSDHHLPHGPLPEADGLVNPRLLSCGLDHLCGVGVAFFLAGALNGLLPGPRVDVRALLDLVALGTLADVVSLTGVNRVLVKNGLLLLAEARRPGVYALKDAAGFDPKARLGAGQVVFGLAPRLNAAGRMGEPGKALALLLAPDVASAMPTAMYLDRQNKARQETEKGIQAEAMAQAKEQITAPGSRMGLTLFAPHWHSGIIGIVASRVMEQTNRPVLILTREGDMIKGSGRSVPEFDIFAAIDTMAPLLAAYGGHHQAAGLSLREDNLDALARGFDALVREKLGDVPRAPGLRLDADITFPQITHALVKEIDLMQPFGLGNPEPVFRTTGLTLKSRREFGDNHLSLELRDPESKITFKAKAWRMADKVPAKLVGARVDLAHAPRLDQYAGLDTLELRLKDLAWED